MGSCEPGKIEMDLTKKQFRNLLIASLITVSAGCVAPQPPVATVWQRLGIPQAGARMRDGLVNRRGNFPGLEKKPPVLAITDPANFDPKKPDMIKAAAEIKADQDLKKQKIKAIKFLADVNCGCYNKDDKVEAAFLAALKDCDPDVRAAAIEGLDTAAGECSKCRTGCETTCCTEKILKQLDEIANGMEKGCYKEPVEEIRAAARALICKCPPPEVAPIVPEELIAPDPVKESPPIPRIKEGESNSETEDEATEAGDGLEAIEAAEITFRLTDEQYGEYDVSPVVIGVSHQLVVNSKDVAKVPEHQPPAQESNSSGRIANPEQLVSVNVVAYRRTLGELLIQMSDAYEMGEGWTAIVVDEAGNSSLAKITDVGGRRILLELDKPLNVDIRNGGRIKMGLVSH